jgi:hypothetical protein
MQRSLRIARARRLTVQSLIAYAIALVFAAHAAHAESGGDGSRTMQSVDQQVQDIKSDVLEIAAELRGLEERRWCMNPREESLDDTHLGHSRA